ncbi:MAG TPA: glutathione S-transferase N-terminal domain-containing protein [Alphaproteobacteria bacterium]
MNTQMYKLFFFPGSAAMAPHAALEEIGAPYELIRVDLERGEQRAPAFLEVNPKGRVPVLVAGADVFTEAAAIILHLADRHPAAGLAPAPGTPGRGHLYEWLLYLSNTVQATFLEYFYPEKQFDDAARRAELKAAAERQLGFMFAHIDAHLGAGGPYLLGPTFSAADLFLHMVARWSRWLEKPAYRYANIKRCTDLVKVRPAVMRMMAAQGIVEQEKAP